MLGDFANDAIPRMLNDTRVETAIALGQERIICGPGTLKDALSRIEAALLATVHHDSPYRIALLSDEEDERRMIFTAIVERAIALGLPVKPTTGSWGIWAREAQKSQSDHRTLHVLADVPPIGKAREGFAAISGSLILLWPSQCAGSALLPERIEDIILAPFSDRPLDKAAHVIDSTWAVLDVIEDVDEKAAASALFHRLDVSALLGTVIDNSKLAKVALAKEAGYRLAAALCTQSALRAGEPLNAADIYHALCPQPERLPPHLRRLWVEGTTDVALLQLAERLTREQAPGLLGGIHIEPIGGVEQVEAALQRCDRDPNLELFMFDADSDGRRGETKVKEQGFPAMILDRTAVMAACDTEWVIEDLLSVSCLDRFYYAHGHLKPAREEITYHPLEGRRLVIRGEDKWTLVEWLEQEATVADLYGLLEQLIIVRRRFALREWPIVGARPANAGVGVRPQPWWFIR